MNQVGLKIAYSTLSVRRYFDICDIIGPSSTGKRLAPNSTNLLTPLSMAKSINLLTGGAQSISGGDTRNSAVTAAFENAVGHVAESYQSNITPRQ